MENEEEKLELPNYDFAWFPFWLIFDLATELNFGAPPETEELLSATRILYFLEMKGYLGVESIKLATSPNR